MEHLDKMLETQGVIQEYVNLNRDKLSQFCNPVILPVTIMKDLELPESQLVRDIVVGVLLTSDLKLGQGGSTPTSDSATVRLLKERVAQLELENKRLRETK